MKRICAYIGFSVAISLLVLNLISINLIFVISAGLIILLIVSLVLPKYRKTAVVPLCIGSAVFACALILMCNFANAQPQLQLNGDTAQTEFYIIDLPEKDSNGKYVYKAKTKSINLSDSPQNIKIYIKSENEINADFYQTVSGELTFNSVADNAYDSYGYWGDNVFLFASCKSYNVKDEYVNSPWKWLIHLRNDIVNTLIETECDDNRGLSVAFLTGNKGHISDKLNSDFKYSGASHLMAVSGFHLTVIIGVVLFVLKKLRVNDKISSFAAIVFTLCCIGIAGFSKSVIRAGIMLIVLLLGKSFNRRSDALNSLGLSVFLICLNPYSVCDVSAQLSVLAVLSLLVLNPVFTNLLGDKNSISDSMSMKMCYNTGISFYSSVSVAVCVFIFSLPVMYLDFGYVSIAGVVSNIVLVPLGSVAIVLSWIVYFCSKIDFAVNISLVLSNAINSMIITIVDFFGGFYSSIVDMSSNFGWVIIVVLIIFALTFILGNKKHFKISAIVCVIFSLVMIVCSLFQSYNSTQVLICENGSLALRQSRTTIVYFNSNNCDYYSVKNFLYSTNSEIDILMLSDFDDEESNDKIYDLISDYGCDTIVTDNFDWQLMDYCGYNKINVCDVYSNKVNENLYVEYNSNDVVSFKINDIKITLNNNDGDIKISNDMITDCYGNIKLDDNEVIYTIYNNSTYKARRNEIWH